MEKPSLNSENNEQENNFEGEVVNELLEQIKRRLKERWDSSLEKNTIETTTEFEKLLKIYKNQGRPIEALANLLSAVESAGDEVERLALFYKDTVYDSRAKMNENRDGSLKFALDYVNLLNWPPKNLKRFKNIMIGKKSIC